MAAFKTAIGLCPILLEIANKEKNFRDMAMACEKATTGTVTKSLRKERADIITQLDQADDLKDFVTAIVICKRQNDELNTRTDVPEGVQKGHATDTFYDKIIDQFKRLGLDAEKRRVDAEETGYLDTYDNIFVAPPQPPVGERQRHHSTDFYDGTPVAEK